MQTCFVYFKILSEVWNLDRAREVLPSGNSPTSSDRKNLHGVVFLDQVASAIGLGQLTKGDHKQTRSVFVFGFTRHVLGNNLELLADKRVSASRRIHFDSVIKQKIVSIILPPVLVRSDRCGSFSLVPKIKASKLGLFFYESAILSKHGHESK